MLYSSFARLAAVPLFALILLGSQAEAQCPTDDNPGANDTCATAIGLGVGGTVYSGVTKDTAGNGAGLGAGDDWYFVNVQPSQTVVMTLAFDHSLGDLNMDSYSFNCTNFAGTSATSTLTQNGESVDVTNNTGSAFTAWFRIYMVDAGGCNSWTMSVQPQLCVPSSVLEENDSCGAAALLSGSSGSLTGLTVESSDEDWYEVVVPAWSALQTTMNSVVQYGNADIEIRTGCTTIRDQSLVLDPSETVTYFNLTGTPVTAWVRVFLSTGVCVGYSLGYQVFPCDNLSDSFEPNNTCSAASPLTGGPNITLINMIVGGGDGEDWWLYTIPANAQLTLNASFLQVNADVGLQLESTCGTVIATANSTTDNEQLTYMNPTAVDQAVRVRVFISPGSAGTCTGYDLSLVSTVDPCLAFGADGLEPNDSCGGAQVLNVTPSLTVNDVVAGGAGGDDWYEFTIPGGQYLSVEANFNNAQGDLELELFAFCGSLVDSSQGTGNSETVSYLNNSITDTVVQVRVFLSVASPGICAPYSLQVDLGPDPCLSMNDAFEDNDDCSTAIARTANSTTTGLRGTLGDADWWSVNVPAGSTQDIVVPYSGGSMFMLVRLDCNGAVLAFVQPAGSTLTYSYTNSSPVEETLYLSVGPSSQVTGNCSDYSLMLSNSGPPSSIVPFCFGDGSLVNCPCSNNSSAGHAGGCAHQNGDGAILVGTGTPSLASDSLHFDLSSAVTNSFALLVSGLNRLPQMGCVGCGIPAFDGLRCAGGDFRRHGSRALNASGDANNGWGPPAGPMGGLGAASSAVAGQTRHYFAFFRTDLASTCMTGQNSSNGVSVTWAP